MVADMTGGRGMRELLAETINAERIDAWVGRHFRKEHAARVVLRAMNTAGPAPAAEAGLSTPHMLSTPHVKEATLPAAGLPAVQAGTTPMSATGSTVTPSDARRTDRDTAVQPHIDTLIVSASAAGEGIVRVDANGHLKFPDPIARELLQWSSGERSLADILVGGDRQAAALLESVTRQEVAEHNITILASGAPQQLHVTAMASRSTDGSLLGALLILRRL